MGACKDEIIIGNEVLSTCGAKEGWMKPLQVRASQAAHVLCLGISLCSVGINKHGMAD